ASITRRDRRIRLLRRRGRSRSRRRYRRRRRGRRADYGRRGFAIDAAALHAAGYRSLSMYALDAILAVGRRQHIAARRRVFLVGRAFGQVAALGLATGGSRFTQARGPILLGTAVHAGSPFLL